MDNKLKTTGVNWYRLSLTNRYDGTGIIEFECDDLFRAIREATWLYHSQEHYYGAELYQYCQNDTAGPFVLVTKLKEPPVEQ